MAWAEGVRRLVVVSDLHLDTWPASAGRDTGGAFASFLQRQALPDDRPGARLVLLGDTFELLGMTGGDEQAARRLDEIAAAHPQLFATLGDCLHHGWSLDLVPGNHDMALTRPVVQRRLAGLLGLSGAQRVKVHPWLYHVPGVLYAEHGHQHHDLNRFPTVLAPQDPRWPNRLFVPPLGAWHGSNGLRLVRALAGSRLAERRARSPAYRARIAEHGRELALPAGAVVQLHELSRFRLGATAFRLARRAVRRRADRGPDGYLIAAAGRIHRVLSQAGGNVPVYAFGHTHRARIVPLSDDAWYVNTGTWTADVRAAGPDRDDPHLFPYLDLQVAERLTPAIQYWRPPAGATAAGGR